MNFSDRKIHLKLLNIVKAFQLFLGTIMGNAAQNSQIEELLQA